MILPVPRSENIVGRNGQAKSIDSSLKPYWKVKASLTLVKDLLLYNNRIVVPSRLRKKKEADFEPNVPYGGHVWRQKSNSMSKIAENVLG